ncbi:MAG TPA: dTDP-4-dehydrorhamnose 3,5-epimerase [Pyrinomonadaceae bacterium]|jgi:dTDP-4-dehydrorhamnose 3,5-epimerase
MKFTETVLKGAFLIDIEPIEDERGFFARSWCKQELEARGLNSKVAQCSISFNREQGTLRGLHYQAKPYEEVKLVWCSVGAICDVIVDLRPDSPSYKKWVANNLTAENRRILYVPEGLAHGFQTLQDRTEVHYQISECYRAEYSRGIRWDDPAFQIDWPLSKRIISARDKMFPDFAE